MPDNQKTIENFIIRKIKKGDLDAYKYVFDLYYNDLVVFVNFYLKDLDEAEELVQSIFVYLWEKRKKIEIKTSLKSYLYTALKNKALNYLRDQKNRSSIRDRLKRDAEIIETNSFDAMEQEQINSAICQAVDKLPEKCRIIYQMRWEEDMSYKEIAEKLQISVRTVEAQLRTAITKLRTSLKPLYNQLILFFLFYNMF